MWCPTNASQFPVVGYPLKLHGHPYAQLQAWITSASKDHFVGNRSPLPPMGNGTLSIYHRRGEGSWAADFPSQIPFPTTSSKPTRGIAREVNEVLEVQDRSSSGNLRGKPHSLKGLTRFGSGHGLEKTRRSFCPAWCRPPACR